LRDEDLVNRFQSSDKPNLHDRIGDGRDSISPRGLLTRGEIVVGACNGKKRREDRSGAYKGKGT
jgi:hypothetical protein